ncbi:MAG: tRNA guanosine(15) transglycosylase TgtA [Thaumarchaeota archaeon]|nr:MAG: tRNA guanosine(15) transglycosylase TgtA [Nitrososphaerota archaeon]
MFFEVSYSDLAGRIGKIKTPSGTIETPAFIPVVHPVSQSVDVEFLKKLGFEAVITNAYITLKQYGDIARQKGIHEIINFDGPVMTDSGGYQVLEYGTIDLEPSFIAQFEKDIESDICVPLDKPTGYGLSYEVAERYVDETIRNSKETLDLIKSNNNTNSIWVGPVQGAEHLDLVKKSAGLLDDMGYEMMALGSPVQLLESYEFAILANIIATLKSTIMSKPIHLFGAGHPLTIPLAVALGCDTFDSASYILYARDNRYMHPNGTSKLDNLTYLACQCPTCISMTAKEFISLKDDERTVELAKHNLYVLRSEVLSVRQAIMEGRLWDYVAQKARAHPKLMEAFKLFKNYKYLEDATPLYKKKAIFFMESIDQYRPEASRIRRILSTFRTDKKKIVLFPDTEVSPFYCSQEYFKLSKKFSDYQICAYNPFIGIIPIEISDIYPVAHNVISKKKFNCNSSKDYPTFVSSLQEFLSCNFFDEILIVADDFMQGIIQDIQITSKNLKVIENSNGVIDQL